MLSLYPFQETCVTDMVKAVRGGATNLLLVSPTGSGKTRMIAEAQRRLKVRCAAAANRVEIKRQIQKTFRNAGLHSSTVSTIGSKHLYESLRHSGSLFIDEAHHSAAPTYQKAIAAAKIEAQLLFGGTATPYRTDGVSLQKDFHEIIVAPSIEELVAQGYLARIRYVASTDVDFDDVRRTVQEEFEAEDAFRKVRIVVQAGDILASWKKHASGKKAIIYCCNQEHCELVEAELLQAGVAVAAVTHRTGTKEREAIVANFEAGILRAIVNCEVFTEGTDLKNVGAIIMVRPVASRGLYKQMLGRGLRPDVPCVAIDLVGNYMKHGNILTEDPIEIMESGRLLKTAGVVSTNDVVEATRLELHVHKVETATIKRVWTPSFFRG